MSGVLPYPEPEQNMFLYGKGFPDKCGEQDSQQPGSLKRVFLYVILLRRHLYRQLWQLPEGRGGTIRDNNFVKYCKKSFQ